MFAVCWFSNLTSICDVQLLNNQVTGSALQLAQTYGPDVANKALKVVSLSKSVTVYKAFFKPASSCAGIRASSQNEGGTVKDIASSSCSWSEAVLSGAHFVRHAGCGVT
jgi:hypothetical protein